MRSGQDFLAAVFLATFFLATAVAAVFFTCALLIAFLAFLVELAAAILFLSLEMRLVVVFIVRFFIKPRVKKFNLDFLILPFYLPTKGRVEYWLCYKQVFSNYS